MDLGPWRRRTRWAWAWASIGTVCLACLILLVELHVQYPTSVSSSVLIRHIETNASSHSSAAFLTLDLSASPSAIMTAAIVTRRNGADDADGATFHVSTARVGQQPALQADDAVESGALASAPPPKHNNLGGAPESGAAQPPADVGPSSTQASAPPHAPESDSRLQMSGADSATVVATTADAASLQEATAARPAGAALRVLPAEFDWRTYVAWNVEVQSRGVTTQAEAEAHYTHDSDALAAVVYRAFNVTLRYTACGGLFNQHYSHLSATALAVLIGANAVIWPPMQERASFAKRFHPNPRLNSQSWSYHNASTVWDLETTSSNLKDRFGISVVEHHPGCRLPNMIRPHTAFQDCPPSSAHELELRWQHPVYLQHLRPYKLAYAIRNAIRRAILGRAEPTRSVLVDLPCTLFMLDARGLGILEDIARAVEWAPALQRLADKVSDGIRTHTGALAYNGIHLRLEQDAVDWATIVGGRARLWQRYKQAMRDARFRAAPRPLYMASGLLKAAKDDASSRAEMQRLSDELLLYNFTTSIEYKEKYLSVADLEPITNEQSGLIDFLVLQASATAVGIGVSTFSFYLNEIRLLGGLDPSETELVMLPVIGTDELFFSAAVVATRTRARLIAQKRLTVRCFREDHEVCFSGKPLKARVYDY